MSEARATINGQDVVVRSGDTVLDAAKRAGVDVPTVCYQEGLPLEGGCRVCLVEVGAERKIVAACHTPIADGDQIVTLSDRLEKLRGGALALMVAEREEGCFAESLDGSEFEALLARSVLSDIGGTRTSRTAEPVSDVSHPYLRFDESRCIVCRRCVSACESVQGQFVYGIAGRGASTRLIIGAEDTFLSSDCTSCGVCVDACPTMAITDRDRVSKIAYLDPVQTTCGYCGVGCQVDVVTRDNAVIAMTGVADAQVNRGHLCAKGRYAHGYQRSKDRLTTPLRRVGDDFEEIGWEEAIAFAAERLATIRDTHGPQTIGALASSRSTNEAAYLLQKFTRAVLGSDNVDCCARVCHSSTALALKTVTGTGAASASYEDIEKAGCIFIAGANPTEAHPVVGARIKQAVLNGVPLIVADPRAIELTDYARVHLQLHPGTNVPVFNAVAKLLIEGGNIDRAFVTERTEDFDAFESFLKNISISDLLEDSGIPEESVTLAADILAQRGPTLFVHGLGLSELTQGTESVMALCNLGMLTGSIGRPGAGMLPLRGQNNVQGAADMGAAPGLPTGYQSLGDESVRVHLEKLWNCSLPSDVGLTTTEMLDAAVAGDLRAMWVQGEDLVHSDPYQVRTIQALTNLDFLIIQDPFFNESAWFADLVLPATTTLENDGTYTNGERRIQRVRPVARAPGDARQDWAITRDIANAMGANWNFESAADVMDEIALAAPSLFGGVAFDRLGGNGLQWPCPATDHPGTSTVHSDGFLRGKGRLTAIPYRPSPEQTNDDYPLTLITGRVLQQYNVGTMTQRTPNRELAPVDALEMHETDAAVLGLREGAQARIESRWGETSAPVTLSDRVRPGTLFLSFHYADSGTNRLVGPQVDPLSKCPEYKITAVKVASG